LGALGIELVLGFVAVIGILGGVQVVSVRRLRNKLLPPPPHE